MIEASRGLRAFSKTLETHRMLHRILTYLKEARLELKKVSWPTRAQTLRYTVAVVLMSIGVAAFLGGLDFLFAFVVNRLVL